MKFVPSLNYIWPLVWTPRFSPSFPLSYSPLCNLFRVSFGLSTNERRKYSSYAPAPFRHFAKSVGSREFVYDPLVAPFAINLKFVEEKYATLIYVEKLILERNIPVAFFSSLQSALHILHAFIINRVKRA